MKKMKRRQCYLLTAALLAAIAPLVGWPIAPVPECLELRIDVRRSVDRVMLQLQTAGQDAGLLCVAIPLQSSWSSDLSRGIRCVPDKSANDRFNGFIVANSIEGTKTITVGFFSMDGTPYRAELHPSIERALQTFIKAMTADANVEHFQECERPKFKACQSPLPN